MAAIVTTADISR